ncbi:MAG: 50S ribosomal protein L25 [Anaerolineales bacterium]|nr:50S ribosomal protein L25 [Anaerolineales bacterium]
MSDIELQGNARTAVGKGLFALRNSGKIPAVIYGPGIEATPIELDAKAASTVLNSLTGSTLVRLKVGQKDYSVLLRDIQRNSVRRTILHVDFYAVPTDREIRVHVPLQFTGISAAVRDFGGILVPVLNDLEVECLPKDLVNVIQVDLAPLEKIGDSIAIENIVLPAGIRVLMDPNETVVTVTAQMAEEEVAAAPAAAVPAEVEVIEKGKKLEEGEEEEEASKEAPAKEAKQTQEPKEAKK